MNQKKDQYPIKVTVDRVVERMTFGKMLRDISSAFNVERGLIYTVKGLFLNPGKTVKSYLYEGRYTVFPPIRFLFFTSAISFLVLFLMLGDEFAAEFQQGFYNGLEEKRLENPNDEVNQLLETVPSLLNTLFEDYFNWLIWLQIPIFSLFTYLFFNRHNYNFVEHLVLNTYIASMINLISIVTYLLLALLPSSIGLGFSFLTTIACYIYVIKSFFNINWWSSVYKTILLNILGYFLYWMVLTVLLMVYLFIELIAMKGS